MAHTEIQRSPQRPQVVIVGGGFGGLRAARALANQPVDVLLVDRNNYHLFQPLLYQVATAGLAADEIAHPLRAILRGQDNLRFRLAEVSGLDLTQRRLFTATGEIRYDYLILAVGGVTHTFGIPSVAQHGLGLKTLEDAQRIRSHLLRQFEHAAHETDEARRRELLTFVVVGGGPSGVEMAGAIGELVHMAVQRDYPNLRLEEVRVILLEAGGALLPALDATLGQAAVSALRQKGVEVRFGAAVTAYDGHRIQLKDQPDLPAATVVWAAGVRAHPLLDALGCCQDRLGRAQVQPSLQLEGHPEVFVIGDAAAALDAQGKLLPMVAPVAMQQGEHAARNVLRVLDGQAGLPFTYRDPGMMATIGRNQAVAQIGSLRLRGFLAWLAWLGVHILQLIGFRNRLLVLVDWAWQYISYDRAVRLIDADAAPAGIMDAEINGSRG
ncbi:NAD(P)/FAD-dependent oxidoreductase [Levilinea saccharolytica]|uniref:NADH:ubiquinone reductase (non-electrogenic) n=1 Tax=Levilinea saccharolytica TaxID=229921 RepID=A0A0M9U371_9CHLR|nr:NAD(P)/FAD-dependent oxidoreductase [Levilinea saccharolytica]KPL82228.1 pyridine nucleotide-disulfide oxidoreductase [Levilinea saccharolytica]GAP19456.1 NADH dehydrogenase, FAD-containing subunit [Levilinea saccharolytica]